MGKLFNAYMGAIAALAMMALVLVIAASGYFYGEKVGFQHGWSSACVTFGPRDNAAMCPVSLYDAEQYRKPAHDPRE